MGGLYPAEVHNTLLQRVLSVAAGCRGVSPYAPTRCMHQQAEQGTLLPFLGLDDAQHTLFVNLEADVAVNDGLHHFFASRFHVLV